MGNSRMSADDWSSYSTRTAAKSYDDIFTAKKAHATLDAKNIKVRESVDSPANPASTPIIIAADNTGSMAELAELIVRKDLGVVVQAIYDRKPVSDPHIMCMSIGDTYYDQNPVQATQFEGGIVITEQIEKFHIEKNGGGNDGESYLTAWYMAAFKTKTDSMLKRKKKGYLFTIGDECCLPVLPKEHIKRFFGDDVQGDLSARDLLTLASQNYEVFHLIVKPVPHQPVAASWKDLLGDRAIHVQDHTLLGEVIVSTIQVTEGADVKSVVDSWSGSTSVVVAKAIGGLAKVAPGGEVARL